MNFSFTGRQGAAEVAGELDALSAAAVADLLFARGITPLRIEPIATRRRLGVRGPFSAAWRSWSQPRIGPVELLLFSRQLNTLLKAGVPILRALACLQESAVGVRMKESLQQLQQSLGSGLDLSTAMAQQGAVFNGFFVAMVRIGEMTGQLEAVLLRLFHHIEFELFMGQQIRSALRYPMFVLAAMAAGVAVINVMVIPAFATVFKSFGAELPLATRVLMATSRFTLDYGALLAAAAMAGAWLVRRWIATPAGRLTWDQLKLRLPLAGSIIRKGMLARFARSFALALKSGVPVEQALSVVARTIDNAYMAQRVDGMRDSIERGEPIARAAVTAGIFTPIVLQMVVVGEETGAVDELMDDVADLYTNEVQYELKTIGQQVEPILIVFLGAMVLVLALGVFLPIWDLGRVALHH